MSAANVAFARALEHWRAESLQEAHAACLEAIGHDEGHAGAAVLASEILLEASGRFRHDPRYAAAVAAQCGLQQLECSEVSYRTEGGEPVASTLVCLRLIVS